MPHGQELVLMHLLVLSVFLLEGLAAGSAIAA